MITPQAKPRQNAPENGLVVRGAYYPGGKFLPKEARYDAAPSGSNTFVPSTRIKGSGRPGQKIGFKSPRRRYAEESDERDYKTPRTISIVHPGKDIHKMRYIDPRSRYDEPATDYEASFGSNLE